MSNSRLALFAAGCLVVRGLLSLAGSFAPPAVRGVVWGLDGTALVVGAPLLAVHHVKLGNEQLAAGFFCLRRRTGTGRFQLRHGPRGKLTFLRRGCRD